MSQSMLGRPEINKRKRTENDESTKKRKKIDTSQSTTKIAEKRELLAKLEVSKKRGSEDVVVETLFRLMYVSMELERWEDARGYATVLRNTLEVNETMGETERKNITALQGACEFYVGLNLAHMGDLVGAIKYYKMSLRLLGDFQRHRVSFARVHRRIGSAILQMTGWEKIGNQKKRVFLLTAWRHFAISAEAFALDMHLDEWRMCIKSIITATNGITVIDGNARMMMEDTLQFMKRQLQRTDVGEDCNARGVLNRILRDSCSKRVDNDAIVKDTKEKDEEMKRLRTEIAKLDRDNLDRKSMEGKLATLHIQVGENLNAIFLLLDTIKDVKWDINPNLLSFGCALIGVCWLNLGDPEAALPYLNKAEYSYDTEHSAEDCRKIRDKRIIAELRLKELHIQQKSTSNPKVRKQKETVTSVAVIQVEKGRNTKQTCEVVRWVG